MTTRRLPVTIVGGIATILCTTALLSLFTGVSWWLGPSVLAVLVLMAAGAVCRRWRMPLPVYLVAYTVGLIVTVTATCAGSSAWLGVIPTRTTFETVRTLIDAGGADIRGLSVPVPSRPGLVLFTVVGVYLVGALVDMIAATLRRPALAGLPLLGLFAVPAAVVPKGVGLLPFALGALGYVGLLLAESRDLVTGWGTALGGTPSAPRPVEENPRTGARSPLGAIGRRIGVAALAGAIIVPALLPDLGGGLLGDRGSTSKTRGVVDPMASLTQRLHSTETVDYLRVRTTGRPTYLRLLALDSFTPAGFVAPPGAIHGTSDDRVPRALRSTSGGPTRSLTSQIAAYPALAEPYLPVPYNPVGITGLRGDWRLAGAPATIFSSSDDTSGLSYTVNAAVPAPSVVDLPTGAYPIPSRYAQDLALPGDLDPRIRDLAQRITRTARSPQQKITAIQNYLRSAPFSYDLTGAPTVTSSALSTFLFQTHRGYCEQFASAMTVLVRSIGLPARVAIGFTQGTAQSDGSWLITNRDAHAWPEVWFPGNGWLQFEPTPAGTANTVVPAYAPAPRTGAAGTDGTQAQNPQDTVPDKAAPAPAPTTGSGSAATPTTGDRSSGGSPFPVLPFLVLGLVIVLLLLVPAAIRIVRRRRRLGTGSGRTFTGSAWRELLDLAADLGFPTPASESPRATARRLGRGLPPTGQEALGRLAGAEEDARYAPPDTRVPAGDEIARDVRTAGRELRHTVDARRRVQAAVAPPSVTREIRTVARDRVRATTGAAERLSARAGRRLRRTHDRV